MDRSKRRIAYCKHGDVVQELAALGVTPTAVAESGPYHYIGSVLAGTAGAPTLLLSLSARDARLQLGGVRARALRYPRLVAPPLVVAWRQLRTTLLIAIELLRFRPTHIICAAAGGPPLWICGLVAWCCGGVLICSRHTSLQQEQRSGWRRLRRRLNLAVIRRSAAVLCHGPYLEQELLRGGISADRLQQFNLSYRPLLRGGDDHSHPPPCSAAPAEAGDSGALTLLYVGRIGREKGVFDLYQAVEPLLAVYPGLRLLYAGDGHDREALTATIDAAGNRDRIELFGAVEHTRLPALLQCVDLVVTPTRSASSESRCKVAIEALVAGRPVVAPNFGPFPYVVQNGGNGLLYYPDSVADLRNKLRRLLDDPALLAHLTAGAEASGSHYLVPERSFVTALQQALAATAAEQLDRPFAARRY